MATRTEELLGLKLAAAGEMGLVLAQTLQLNSGLIETLLMQPKEGTVIGVDDRELLEVFKQLNESAGEACDEITEAAFKIEAEIMAQIEEADYVPGQDL